MGLSWALLSTLIYTSELILCSPFDLFLVWIQIPMGTSVTNCNHKHGLMLTCRNDVDMFTWGHIVLSSTKRAHINWNWHISRGKYLKIDWSIKMPFHWLIMGVASSYWVMGSCLNRRQEANAKANETSKSGNKGTKLLMREPWDNEAS